jgi:hypothetical protein
MVDKKNIQTHLGSLFNFASQVPYCPNHILCLLQSVKSLIGINPEIIPENLLKYVENRVGEFEPCYTYPGNQHKELQPEVISIEKLKKMILKGKKQQAQEYLGFLLLVANPRHISEYLLEVAAEISPQPYLFCWTAVKSIKIMAPEDIPAVLYLCLDALLEESNTETVEVERFLVHAYYHQIEKTALVRGEKILSKIDALMKTYPMKMEYVQQFPGELAYLIKEKGREGIHVFLNNLSLEELNDELLYQLDGLRSVISFNEDWEKSQMFPFIQSSEDVNC